MPQFTVHSTSVISAQNAKEAEEKGQDRLPRGSKVVGVAADSVKGATMSDDLKWFLDGECQNNDADPEGYTTNLDYCEDSFDQMPTDTVVEQCRATLAEGDTEDDFARRIGIELNALIEQYGGKTTVATLLDEVGEPRTTAKRDIKAPE